MAKTPEQFIANLATLERRIDANVAHSVGKASLALKRSVEANLRASIGPEQRMSGVGRRSTASRGGAKVGVRYDIKGRRNPTSILRMTGPAHLIERDTKAHTITARGRTRTARGRARRGARVLAFRGGGFATSVSHPGTRGKHPWQRGVRTATPVAMAHLRGAAGRSLREVFKG